MARTHTIYLVNVGYVELAESPGASISCYRIELALSDVFMMSTLVILVGLIIFSNALAISLGQMGT